MLNFGHTLILSAWASTAAASLPDVSQPFLDSCMIRAAAVTTSDSFMSVLSPNTLNIFILPSRGESCALILWHEELLWTIFALFHIVAGRGSVPFLKFHLNLCANNWWIRRHQVFKIRQLVRHAAAVRTYIYRQLYQQNIIAGGEFTANSFPASRVWSLVQNPVIQSIAFSYRRIA